MKIIALLAIFVCSPIVFADSQGLEDCAYMESKTFLNVLKNSKRIATSSRVEGIAKFMKAPCIDKQHLSDGLSEGEIDDALLRGTQKAAREILGEIVYEKDTRPLSEVAQKTLIARLRAAFKDFNITIKNPEALREENNELFGKITLSNDFVCDTNTKVSKDHRDCSVQFECLMGTMFNFQKTSYGCE